jgi:toxin FitB
MILLDTNVVSELMRREPASSVVRWLDAQPATSVWITSITVVEIEFGLLPSPKIAVAKR